MGEKEFLARTIKKFSFCTTTGLTKASRNGLKMYWSIEREERALYLDLPDFSLSKPKVASQYSTKYWLIL